ncbi:hypothetical protein OAO01_00840 [Oligoflexia bacterium]|nr:hypothetical protein [Oligoflexia bacterium]
MFTTLKRWSCYLSIISILVLGNINIAFAEVIDFAFDGEFTQRYSAEGIIRGEARVGNTQGAALDPMIQAGGWNLSLLVHFLENGNDPVARNYADVVRIPLSSAAFQVDLSGYPDFALGKLGYAMLVLTLGPSNASPFPLHPSHDLYARGFSNPIPIARLNLPNQQHPGDLHAIVGLETLAPLAFTQIKGIVPVAADIARRIANGSETLLLTDAAGIALPTRLKPWAFRFEQDPQGQRLAKSFMVEAVLPLAYAGYSEFAVRIVSGLATPAITFSEMPCITDFLQNGELVVEFDGPRAQDQYTARLPLNQANLISEDGLNKVVEVGSLVEATGSNANPAQLTTMAKAFVTLASGSCTPKIDLLLTTSNHLGHIDHYFRQSTLRVVGVNSDAVTIEQTVYPKRDGTFLGPFPRVGQARPQSLELFPRLAAGQFHVLRDSVNIWESIAVQLPNGSPNLSGAENTFVTLNTASTGFAFSDFENMPGSSEAAGVPRTVPQEESLYAFADHFNYPSYNDSGGFRTWDGFYSVVEGLAPGGTTGGGDITFMRPQLAAVLNARGGDRPGALFFGARALRLFGKAVLRRQFCASLFDRDANPITHTYFDNYNTVHGYPDPSNPGNILRGWSIHKNSCLENPDGHSKYFPNELLEAQPDYQAQVAVAYDHVPYMDHNRGSSDPITYAEFKSFDAQHNTRFSAPLTAAMLTSTSEALRDGIRANAGILFVASKYPTQGSGRPGNGTFEKLVEEGLLHPGHSGLVDRGLEPLVAMVDGGVIYNRDEQSADAFTQRFEMFSEGVALAKDGDFIYRNGSFDNRNFEGSSAHLLSGVLTQMASSLGTTVSNLKGSSTDYIWFVGLGVKSLLKLYNNLEDANHLSTMRNRLGDTLRTSAESQHSTGVDSALTVGGGQLLCKELRLAEVKRRDTGEIFAVPRALADQYAKTDPQYCRSYILMASMSTAHAFPAALPLVNTVVNAWAPHLTSSDWASLSDDKYGSEARYMQLIALGNDGPNMTPPETGSNTASAGESISVKAFKAYAKKFVAAKRKGFRKAFKAIRKCVLKTGKSHVQCRREYKDKLGGAVLFSKKDWKRLKRRLAAKLG